MMRIITAIGDNMLNQRLRETGDYDVLTDDINDEEELYKWLEKEEVDILIICRPIIKKYSLEEFQKLMCLTQKNLKMICFNFGMTDLEEYCSVEKYQANDIAWSELKITLDKIEKGCVENEENDTKIIGVTGPFGIGKSTFCTYLAKCAEDEDKKILLIDFDLSQNCIRTILRNPKLPKDSSNIKDMIIKIDKNLDVLCNLDMHFKIIDNINYLQIKEMFNNLKKDYDYIIVDTSSVVQDDYLRRILYNCTEILFLVEPNVLGVKKAHNMLEILKEDWEISNKKIKIVLNKTSIYQIYEELIKEIFPDYEIIGNIKYDDWYNLMKHKCVNKKEIQQEYYKIFEQL